MRIFNENEFIQREPLCFDPNKIRRVQKILDRVRASGDAALRFYTKRYDRVILNNIRVKREKIQQAVGQVNLDVMKALAYSAKKIAKFARMQKSQFRNFEFRITSGVSAGQRVVALDRVGIYVPGGHFPLVSSLLMGAIPARIAGVRELAICTPPGHGGSIHPILLAAADLCGIDEIYCVGGAQAIGALAFGTSSIRAVDKIVGPGNQYVSMAKKLVYGQVGIDFIAGPTEIAILADETASPDTIAADLIAQAEHDRASSAWLIATSGEMAERVRQAVSRLLYRLGGLKNAAAAIRKNSGIVVVESLKEAVSLANRLAPEHLGLQIRNPRQILNQLRNYGTVFLGEMTPEALGDYSSGLNHILPTSRASRYSGGLGVRDFLKIQTTLEVTALGMARIGLPARTLARAEGMVAHARSLDIRLERIRKTSSRKPEKSPAIPPDQVEPD